MAWRNAARLLRARCRPILRMATDQQMPDDADILGRGEGNETAAGVSLHAGAGAIFASQPVAEAGSMKRFRSGNAHIRSIQFETEAPLDDFATLESERLSHILTYHSIHPDF